jgi:hypothetical protein
MLPPPLRDEDAKVDFWREKEINLFWLALELDHNLAIFCCPLEDENRMDISEEYCFYMKSLRREFSVDKITVTP